MSKPGFMVRLRLLALGAVLGFVLLSLVLTLPLRWLDPPVSSYMLQDRQRYDRDILHAWLDYNRISDDLKLAVIAAEDQRFPDHLGFDFQQIRTAIDNHRRGGRLRGASTLTQQVSRNLYLWPGDGDMSRWTRKGLEAWLTFWLEVCLPKRRILEIYLNVAEFGPAVYGAEAASRYYFGHGADALRRHEAIALASVLPNPAVYSVHQPQPLLQQRRDWIGRQMGQLGGSAWLHASEL